MYDSTFQTSSRLDTELWRLVRKIAQAIMYRSLMHFLVVCIGGMVLVLVEQAPAEAYELHYLSVGNSEYQDNQLELPDANWNARQIAEYLQQAGAVDGITLVSKQGAYVTRDDVLGALSEMASKAKAGRDPLVVYYFIGHGMAQGEGFNHVSFAGDYALSDPAEVARSRAIIATQEVKQFLNEQHLPYILILDNCYYRESEGAVQMFSRGIQASFGKAAETLDRALSTSPESAIVLYAAKHGHYVQMLPHPWNERHSIGPLGRRLLLLLKATFESEKDLSIGRFLEQMNDPTFDPPSVVGDHDNWIFDSSAALIPADLKAKFTKNTVEIRLGSGKSRQTVVGRRPKPVPDRDHGDSPHEKNADPMFILFPFPF
jgi:hypothetical protein